MRGVVEQGAQVSQEQFDKVMGYIELGKQEAECVTGGEQVGDKGWFIKPTIFTGVDNKMRIAQKEIFGPILSVIEVASTDEAIKIANETDYGLTASVFTASNRGALRAARAIKAGTVTVNCYGEGDISTPFGGLKQSGFGGRDNGLHAHDQYTEGKTIWIDLSDPKDGDNVG